MKKYGSLAIQAAVVALYVNAAHAQAIGGGGGGLISGVIQWAMTNIIAGLIMAAIVGVGLMLMFGRHTLAGIAVMVGGVIVVTHYQDIYALLPIGG